MRATKRIIAGFVAAVMVLPLASCGKRTTWSAVINNIELRAGIFISYQMNAFFEASNYIPEEEYDENGSLINADFSVLDITIEDKPAGEWINDTAIRKLREYVAIEQKFSELGLALPENEEERAKLYVEQLWEYNPYAAYGIDYDAYGVLYEKLGIGKQSQIDIYLNESKSTEIFKYFYGKNGTNAVTADEIERYIRENTAMIKYIEMPLKDGEGNLLKSDGKAERLEMANAFIERANAGESFDELIREFDDYYNFLIKEAERAAAEAAGTEYADDAFAAVDAEEPRDETEHTKIISKDDSYPNKAVVEKVFSGEASVGDIVLIELDEVYYVVQMLDIISDADYMSENDDSVRLSLRKDDYLEMLSSWTQGQNVVINEAALSRYTPDMLNKRLA
jgi:hypothetical protein